MKNNRLLILIALGSWIMPGICRGQSEILFKYLATWGEKGSGPGEFLNPQGISIGPTGSVYIADTGNQRIQKFDRRGRFITEIGGFGWHAEQFDSPVSVWAENGLDVFVADLNNHRIQRYDKDLHFLAAFVSTESWPEYLQFGFPMDAALSGAGELFCLDGENRRVLKLDILGVPQRAFGDFDAGDGRLLEPRRLLLTADGRVFVSDRRRQALLIFDVHGNYLASLGRTVLKAPEDMVALPGNWIVVADAQAGVQCFDQTGRLAGQLTGSPEGGFRFQEPAAVAHHEDRFFVVDSQRHTVDVFTWEIRKGSD